MARVLEEYRIVQAEVEAACALSPAEDAQVNSHCADLEACLASLRSRQSPSRKEVNVETEILKERLTQNVPNLSSRFNVVETSVTEEAKVIELHNINVVPRLQIQEIVRSKPVVEVQEQVRTVPKLEVREVERVVEVPHVQYVNKFIEVPEVRVVEKIVEVPQVHIQEVVKEVPRIQVHEIVRHVPRVEVQEVVRAVPKVEVKVVEKLVEVPRIQTVEKIVEVPQVKTVEKLVQVPQVHTIEKIVPVEKIIKVEKPVYVSGPAPPVEVLECVPIGGAQVPFFAEALLQSMPISRLRDHAFLLYNALGHPRIGSSVPVAHAELLSWVVNVQRQHIEPFRGKASSTSRNHEAPPPAGYPPSCDHPVSYGTRTRVPIQSLTSPRPNQMTSPGSCPLAVAGVDTTHDGIPNFLYVGADSNGDGIPDALQGSVATSGSIKSGGITPTARLQGPDRSSVGRPLQQPAFTTRGRSAEPLSVELIAAQSRGPSRTLDQTPLGVTQAVGVATSSIATGGSTPMNGSGIGSAMLIPSGTVSPALGVTASGRASAGQLTLPSSVAAPTATPRSQTPGRYQAGPVRSTTQLNKSGSSSALLSL